MAASLLVGVMMLGITETAFASEDTVINLNKSVADEAIINTDESEIVAVEDLSVQLNDMYHRVGKSLNIDYIYVKILHLLAGGKAIYPDKRPNIYSELTADNVDGPFDIKGAKQSYSLQAPWAFCPDEELIRPSKYYIADAAYSTTSEVVKIMNQRYFADRGQMRTYFDALSNDVRTNIIFCEAIMVYTGASQEAVESFYPNYEKILYEKEKNENVIESNEDGTFKFKDKFKEIMVANNIDDEYTLNILSIVLSFDSKLAQSNDPDAIKEAYVIPYKQDYTSRENMMAAAMSVVGKVRYVWGGGHVSSGSIDGINPSWKAFYNAYPTSENELGYGMCIKPTKSWCPIHGMVENENGCLMMANTVYSVEQYVDSRKEIESIDTQAIEGQKYIDLMEDGVDFDHGVNSHRLDGLDCSGYASWLYNQITNKRKYDSGARNFINAGGLKSIEYGSKMLPGDVFSWGAHIVVVIGPSTTNSKAYVMVEASPNMVKFGVMYYGSASQSDINKAIVTAREANDLIGNIPKTEKTHIYNMDSVGYTTVTVESESSESNSDELSSATNSDDVTNTSVENDGAIQKEEKVIRYAEIGRLGYPYMDENLIVADYGKKIKEMTAQEIIQYTINNYSEEYISGLDDYSGTEFNIDKFRTNNIDNKILENNKIDVDSIINDNKQTVEVLKTGDADKK